MITLKQACAIYSEHSRWPISYITENETEWAFFPATTGFNDINVDVVDKRTGELKYPLFFDYVKLPRVAIPEEYVKDPPKKNSTGLAALLGPLVYTDGTPVEL